MAEYGGGGRVSYPLYALPAIPLAMMAMTYYVYLPKFLIDHHGFAVASLSLIILISRIWDAVLDPVIGRLSDHQGTRGSRRKNWILCSTAPLAILFASFFYWPVHSSPHFFFIVSVLFFLFFSTVLIPFEAWGITLARDYDQRNTIMTWREGFVIFGTFMSGAVPFGLEVVGFGDKEILPVCAVLYGLLLVMTVYVAWTLVPEPPLATESSALKYSWRQTLAQSLKNQPFRILVFAYILAAIGAVIPATLILFYVEHVLESENANIFLSLYFLSGIATLPLWLGWSRKLEKKWVWIGALLLNTGSFMLVYFLSAGQELAYALLVCISGMGFGATMALPPSMQADVIELDYHRHSVRREGIFVGLWTIARKISAAIAASLALFVLSLAGYTHVEPPSSKVIETIRVWYTLIPSLFNFLAIVVATKYSLSRSELSTIQRGANKR